MKYMDNQNQNAQNNQIQPDDQQAPKAPISPTGSPYKEIEPPIRKEQPLIKASEEEPRLHPEVIEAGVETVADKPKLDDGHFGIGMRHARESTPVKTEPSNKVNYPITAQKANQIVKSKRNIKDSILWLATSVLRQIKTIRKGEN